MIRVHVRGKAAITGDFVQIAMEVNPVLKALREHGIEVAAIHNQMLGDRPRRSSCISGHTMMRRSLRQPLRRRSPISPSQSADARVSDVPAPMSGPAKFKRRRAAGRPSR